MEANERSSIADSPWYWVLVFSLMAIAALVVVRAKYDTRQAGIERQYQARERVAEKLNAENNPQAGMRIDDQASRHPYSTPDEHLIPLWPLAVFLGLIAMLAAAMLSRASRAVPGPDNNVASP